MCWFIFSPKKAVFFLLLKNIFHVFLFNFAAQSTFNYFKWKTQIKQSWKNWNP